MTDAHDARSVPSTMFETYRMLGQGHEVELERLAQAGRRAPKPRARRRAERPVSLLPLTFRLAVAKLKALAS